MRQSVFYDKRQSDYGVKYLELNFLDLHVILYSIKLLLFLIQIFILHRELI